MPGCRSPFLMLAIAIGLFATTLLWANLEGRKRHHETPPTVDALSMVTTKEGNKKIRLVGQSLQQVKSVQISPDLINGKRLLSSLNLHSIIRPIAIEGNIAVTTSRFSGFHIIDISDTSAPELIHTEPIDAYAFGIALSKNILYINTIKKGLWIYDLSRPKQPVLLSQTSASGAGGTITLVGKYAFIAGGRNGAYCLDVSDPRSPEIIHHFATDSFVWDIQFLKPYLYVASNRTDIRTYRFSPGQPLQESTSVKTLQEKFKSIAINKQILVVSSLPRSIYIFDIENKTNKLIFYDDKIDNPTSLLIHKNYLFVGQRLGVSVYDIKNKNDIKKIGTISTPNGIYKLTFHPKKQLILGTNGRQVLIIDLSEPLNLNGTQQIFSSPSSRIAPSKNGVYLSTNQSLYKLHSLLDVEKPALMHQFTGKITSFYADEKHLFVLTDNKEIHCLANHSNPCGIENQYSLDEPASDLFANDHWVVATHDQKITLLRHDEARNPKIFSLPNSIDSVSVFAGHLYIACENEGLWHINLRVDRPTELTRIYSGAWPESYFERANEITVCQGQLIVANTDPGLQIYDIQPETKGLELAQEIDLGFQATKLTCSDKMIGVSNAQISTQLFQRDREGKFYRIGEIPGTFSAHQQILSDHHMTYLDVSGNLKQVPLPKMLPFEYNEKGLTVDLPMDLEEGDYHLELSSLSTKHESSAKVFFHYTLTDQKP